MEKAILISNPEHLKLVGKDFKRVYLGSEFCDHRIPSEKVLSESLETTLDKNLSFTFVTPFISNPGLKKLEPLFKILMSLKVPIEVVANDWGVVWLIKEKYPRLEIVLGRLMNKMKKDTKIMNYFARLNTASRKVLTSTNITVPLYRKFLKSLGIRRLEFDLPLQGITFNLNYTDYKFKGSLYFPYGYISTSRYCLSSALTTARKIGGCRRECDEYYLLLDHYVTPVSLYYSGRTYFYKNNSLPSNIKKQGFNRIVYQCEIPR